MTIKRPRQWTAKRLRYARDASWGELTAVLVVLLSSSSGIESFHLRFNALHRSNGLTIWACPPKKDDHHYDQSHNSSSTWDDVLRIRRLHGHAAAQPLFSQFTTESTKQPLPTAALHLATMSQTREFENVFNINTNQHKQESLSSLATLLREANYTNQHVQQVLGIRNHHHPQYYASAPIYVRTVGLSQSSQLQQQLPPAPTSSTHCLVGLCLLGWAYPYQVVERCLSPLLIKALLECGILLVEQQQNMVFSVVSLTPLSLSQTRSLGSSNTTTMHDGSTLVGQQTDFYDEGSDHDEDDIWLATDWHPNVLATTRPCFDHTIEPVMYIGPDSLGLVQIGIPSIMRTHHHLQNDKNSPLEDDNNSNEEENDPFHLVDICTGSGVQAVAAASHYIHYHLNTQQSLCRPLQATLVDINPRALQCAEFNFHLNGLLQHHRMNFDSNQDADAPPPLTLRLVLADVCQPDVSCRVRIAKCTGGSDRHFDGTISEDFCWTSCPSLETALSWQPVHQNDNSNDLSKAYHIHALTANPPFVPSPPATVHDKDEDDTLSYGLFSTYRGKQVSWDDDAGDEISANSLTENDGSSSGEEVWRSILDNLVRPFLAPGGRVGVVSEFFWSKAMPLTERLPYNPEWQVLLVVNQFTLDMDEYAKRRSFCENKDEEDYQRWYSFLSETLGYEESSPGFLFLERQQEGDTVNREKDYDNRHLYQSKSIPRSKYGSLWTPSNPVAQEQVRTMLNDVLSW